MDNIETPSLAECLPRVPPRTRRSRLVFPNPRQATEPKRRQLQLAKHTRKPHERDLAETHRDSEVRGARDLRHEDREREDGGEQHDLCGEPHGAADARIRVSDQNAARCTRGNVSTVHPRPPASDEDHASAGARSAPASLLHPRKAAATGPLSASMRPGVRRRPRGAHSGLLLCGWHGLVVRGSELPRSIQAAAVVTAGLGLRRESRLRRGSQRSKEGSCPSGCSMPPAAGAHQPRCRSSMPAGRRATRGWSR
jgi:hypothetical protein